MASRVSKRSGGKKKPPSKKKSPVAGEANEWVSVRDLAHQPTATGAEWASFIASHPEWFDEKQPHEEVIAEAGGGGDCLYCALGLQLRLAGIGKPQDLTVSALRQLNALAFQRIYGKQTLPDDFWSWMNGLYESLVAGEDRALRSLITRHFNKAYKAGGDPAAEQQALVRSLVKRIEKQGGWWGDAVLLSVLTQTPLFKDIGVITFVLPNPEEKKSTLRISVFDQGPDAPRPNKFLVLFNEGEVHWQPLALRDRTTGRIHVLLSRSQLPPFILAHRAFQSWAGSSSSPPLVPEEKKSPLLRVSESKRPFTQDERERLLLLIDTDVSVLTQLITRLRKDVVSRIESLESKQYEHELGNVHAAFDMLEGHAREICRLMGDPHASTLTREQSQLVLDELEALKRSTLAVPFRYREDRDALLRRFFHARWCRPLLRS